MTRRGEVRWTCDSANETQTSRDDTRGVYPPVNYSDCQVSFFSFFVEEKNKLKEGGKYLRW